MNADAEWADTLFLTNRELDAEFKRYGFDKDKEQIVVDHETYGPAGVFCTYFKISKKIAQLNGNGSERVDFYIGAFIRPFNPGVFQIESINVILYRDVEINGEKITMPMSLKKFTTNPLPTKNDILKHHLVVQQSEQLSKAKMLLETLQNRNVTISSIQKKRSRLN